MLDLTNWESASERGPSPMCHTQTLALSAPPEPGTDCGAGRPPPPLVTIHQNPHLGEKEPVVAYLSLKTLFLRLFISHFSPVLCDSSD